MVGWAFNDFETPMLFSVTLSLTPVTTASVVGLGSSFPMYRYLIPSKCHTTERKRKDEAIIEG